MKKIVGKNFFRQNGAAAARELLGKFLARKIGQKTIALMITETEAYDGFADLASHASRGKTKRNAPMFESGGVWYVYFTYGMHWMLNIVCGEKDYPSAVLIRGAGKIIGPARLTKFLKIGKKFNAKKAEKKTGLWIEDRGVKIKPSEITRLPRVGVGYAGPAWSKKPLRFVLKKFDKT